MLVPGIRTSSRCVLVLHVAVMYPCPYQYRKYLVTDGACSVLLMVFLW
jgi:hypothetical protein